MTPAHKVSWEITEERVRALADQLRCGVKRSTACALLGLEYTLVRKWLDKGRRIAERMCREQGDQEPEHLPPEDYIYWYAHMMIARAEAELQAQCIEAVLISPDWRAKIAYLESRFGRDHGADGAEDEQAAQADAERALLERLARLADSVDNDKPTTH